MKVSLLTQGAGQFAAVYLGFSRKNNYLEIIVNGGPLTVFSGPPAGNRTAAVHGAALCRAPLRGLLLRAH